MRRGALVKRVALNGAGLLVALFAAFPVYWMIATSLKPNREIFSATPGRCRPTRRWSTTGRSLPGI